MSYGDTPGWTKYTEKVNEKIDERERGKLPTFIAPSLIRSFIFRERYQSYCLFKLHTFMAS